MSITKYTTRFSLAAHLYDPSPLETGEIFASIDRLKDLMPIEINPEKHPTILYVVGNLFVPGTLNKNDDGVTIEDGLKMYKSFEGQQINLEHNRGCIVGYIVRAGLSEFGTDRIITEEEARAADKPYNVSIVVAIWKVADKNLVRYILQAAEPNNPNKDDLSLSFEVGFNEYNIVALPNGVSNLALANHTITPDSLEFATWNKRLRINKGSGLYSGQKVGTLLRWPIIPLGGGIVAMPAAAVRGITPITDSNKILNVVSSDEGLAKTGVDYEFSSTQCTFSKEEAEPILSYGKLILDEHVYHGEDGSYGRENEIHCTALYGIKGAEAEPLQKALKGFGPVVMKLGKVSAFKNDDKEYDVLKVDVVSEDLHRLHSLIQSSTEHEDTWPTYTPHVTIAYVKRGLADSYIGDPRFEGKTITFSSITFSPHTGDKTEIDLISNHKLETEDQVYTEEEQDDYDIMASTPTRIIKLSAGWQEKLVAIKATRNAEQIQVSHVQVVLSDGRKLAKAKVIDASTLELPEEVSLAGCVITDMTPGEDSLEYIAPGKDDIYPTQRAEKGIDLEKSLAVVCSSVNDSKVPVDAFIKDLTAALNNLSSIKSTTSSVSSLSTNLHTSTPIQSMKLEDLKVAIAAVKSVEDLPTAMANVALFADAIAKASEEQAAARVKAEQSAITSETSLSEVKAQLETLTKSHNDLIAAQQAVATEQAFQTRMAAVEEVFNFDDVARADVIEEIKACVDDAAFTKWMARAQRMYKGFAKTSTVAGENPFAKKDDKDKEEGEKSKDKEEMKEKECKVAAKTALASAVVNIVDTAVSNVIDAAISNGDTLKERYSKILMKNARVGGETLEEIDARAKATIKTTR